MESILCFLCRVSYNEKDKLEKHLVYEHGIIFNADFVSRVSQFRTVNARMPVVDLKAKSSNNNKMCRKCKEPSKPVATTSSSGTAARNSAPAGKAINSMSTGKVVNPETASTLEETVPGNNGNDESSSSAQPPKVKPRNIRDKTNMYCNVCDLTLATRILFLSHCSTVHDVKFKGKSGQPLVIPQDRERSPAASHYDTTSGFSQSPARKRARMLDMGSIRSTDNVGTTMVLEIDDQLPLIRRLTGDEDGEYQKKVKRDLEKVVERDEEKVQKDQEEVKRDIEKAIRNRENEIRDLEKAIRNQEKINRDQKMIMKKLKKKMKKLQNILSNPGDPTQTLQRCKDLLKKVTAITD